MAQQAMTPQEYAEAYEQARHEQEQEQKAKGQDKQQSSKATAAPRKRMAELGVMALMFGIPLWWAAATNTLLGLVQFFNIVLSYIHVPFQIPQPSGWWVLSALVLGWLYSRSEITHIPLRRTGKGWVFFGVWAALTWLAVISTDVGAQYLGAVDLNADAWPIERWMASTLWAAIGWSIFLTFIPDRMILWGAKQTRLDGLLAKIGIR